jgi:hypothetical protein
MKTSDQFPRTRTSPRRTPMFFCKTSHSRGSRERASCRARDLRPRSSPRSGPTTGMQASRGSESGNDQRTSNARDKRNLLSHLQVYYSRAKWAANLQRQLQRPTFDRRTFPFALSLIRHRSVCSSQATRRCNEPHLELQRLRAASKPSSRASALLASAPYQ